MRNGVKLQAHKGVEYEYPENTMPSFEAAAKLGYEMIELDLGVTKDGKIVVLHNETINSKARTKTGEKIEEEIRISDITYEEALKYDFGIWFSEEFKGTKIPLFEDVLKLAEENDILLKIDNKIRKFSEEDLEKLFDLFRSYKTKICISCWNEDIAKKVIAELPDAEISFDGMSNEDELKKIRAIAGDRIFSVWMPVDYEMAKWADPEWFITPEKAERIKKYARLCIWAIKDLESFENAAAMYHPYAAETTGIIKPE